MYDNSLDFSWRVRRQARRLQGVTRLGDIDRGTQSVHRRTNAKGAELILATKTTRAIVALAIADADAAFQRRHVSERRCVKKRMSRGCCPKKALLRLGTVLLTHAQRYLRVCLARSISSQASTSLTKIVNRSA